MFLRSNHATHNTMKIIHKLMFIATIAAIVPSLHSACINLNTLGAIVKKEAAPNGKCVDQAPNADAGCGALNGGTICKDECKKQEGNACIGNDNENASCEHQSHWCPWTDYACTDTDPSPAINEKCKPSGGGGGGGGPCGTYTVVGSGN